jgi:branched-chain amino acid transport system substrate-binding protein
LGEQIKLGVQVAVEENAAEFAKLGFKLELAAYDDQANPDTGVANANRIINDPTVLGVIGHYNSGVTIPSSEVYARVDLVDITPAATNEKITDRGLSIMNRICGRDDVQGPAGAEFAVKTLKAKKIFVIHDKTPYGQGVATNFRKAAVGMGATIPDNAFVGTEERANFAPLLTQIMAFKPDAVYFGGIYDQIGVFAKQYYERGLKAPIVCADALDSSEYPKLAGAKAAGNSYFTTVAGPVSQFPKAKAFTDKFQKEFGKGAEGYSIYAYDSACILLNAIKKCVKDAGGKMPERKAVAQAVRATDYQGLTGEIAFDKNGDVKQATYFIIKVAATGNWADNVILKTIQVASPGSK